MSITVVPPAPPGSRKGIPGTVGLLGRDYPDYCPVGDTRTLADLLRRAETDAGFYN